ncbi:MAG: phage tail tip lysozyme [Candidatus Margulisiibacteriota bacterium]
MPQVDSKVILQGLLDRGLSPAYAAAVAGNAAQESGFNTHAVGDNGNALGLLQWNGPRKQKLVNFANSKGVDVADPNTQMDYFIEEMKSPEYAKLHEHLNSLNNPRQAAFTFSKRYERPRNESANNGHRMSAADSFFKMISPISTAQADDMPSEQLMQEYQAWKSKKEQPSLDGESKSLVPDPALIEEYNAWKKSKEPSLVGEWIGKAGQNLKDEVGGAIRGAGSIGATVLAPIDAAANAMGVENSFIGRKDRRQAMDEGLNSLGVNTDSTRFKTGKLGAEIAGTAGAGNVLAAGAKAVPVLSKLAPALESAGMKGANIAQKAIGGAATGSASAGLVDPESAVKGGVIGAGLPPGLAVAGKVGGKVGGKLGKGIKDAIAPAISKEVKDLAIKAKKYGIDIPIDRLYDSRPLNALSSALNYVPLSGRAGVEDDLAKQLNVAVSKTIGQDTHNITKALRDAKEVLGTKFDDTLKNNTVKVDDKLLSSLAKIEENTKRIFGGEIPKTIQAQIDEIINTSENGVLNGENAYRIKRELDRMGKGGSNEAYHFREIKDSLLDALNRSLGKEKAKEFSKVREQYANMLMLKKIAKNGAEGDISIARLANIKDPKSKQLQDLADIAAQFVKARETPHGAMQRATAGAVGFMAGGAPGLAAGMALGRGANAALNSKALREKILSEGGTNKLSRKYLESAAKAIPVIATQQNK